MGNKITSIGDYALYGCSSLAELKLSERLTSLGLEFIYGTQISTITIPKVITSTPNYAAESTSSYATWRKSNDYFLGSEYGYGVFTGADKLKEVIFEKGLTEIPAYALYNAPSIEKAIIPNTVTSIGKFAFIGDGALQTVDFPDSVTTIGNYAFYLCTTLNTLNPGAKTPSEIIFSEDLKSIGDYAFYGCSSILSVTFTNTAACTIGNATFKGCSSMTSFDMGNKVTSIGEYAFSGCSALSTLILSENLTSIGVKFIEGSKIASITIPATVTSTPNYATSSTSSYANWYINYDYYIGSEYGYGDFTGATALKEVIFANGTLAIPDYALYNAPSIRKVVIPDGCTSIGKFSFTGDSALQILALPDSVQTIGLNSFYLCTSLYSANPSGIDDGVMNFPKNLTKIGDHAFDSCASIQNIKFTNTYNATIGNWAFSGCGFLEIVRFTDNFTSFGNGAFNDCGLLLELNLPKNLTSIGYSFISGTHISTITIPPTVTATPNYAKNPSSYSGWGMNNDFYFGAEYGYGAFTGATALKEVVFESGMTAIPNYALYNAPAVRTVVIPETVKSIGNYCFAGNTSIEYVFVPKNVTSLSTTAFTAMSAEFLAVVQLNSYAHRFCEENLIPYKFYDDNFVSIVADQITDSAEINISGYVPKGNEVKIYDGDVLLGTFVSRASYRYVGTVTLPERGYRNLKAVTVGENGEEISAITVIYYDEQNPSLKEFWMIHNASANQKDIKINLLDTVGTKTNVYFQPNVSFTFGIKIANSDKVKKVYVVSKRDGIEKFLEDNMIPQKIYGTLTVSLTAKTITFPVT